MFGREQILTRSPRVLSRFEAATGALGTSVSAAGREEEVPRLTVIVDAYRFDVVHRAALVAAGLSSGGLVVLCDLDGSRAPAREGQSRVTKAPTTSVEPRWYHHGPSGIGFTSDLSSAIAEVGVLRRRLGSDVVVVADEGLARLIGGDVVPVNRRGVAAFGDATRLIVLGDAASVRLTPAISECAYVMPAPLVRDRFDERALAHALMAVVPRARRAGTVSLDPAERLARGWNIVSDVERGVASAGLGDGLGEQLGKEWGLERGSEREGAHLGPE